MDETQTRTPVEDAADETAETALTAAAETACEEMDDAESEEFRPYINIFAVRADDVDNEVYKKCVEIYQTKPVLDALQEESGGTAVFADKFTTAQLQQYLKDIENDIKQH